MSRIRLLLAASVLLTVVACQNDEITVPDFAGRLEVTISGLPAGVEAPVTITSPDGVTIAVPGSQTFPLLPAGTYAVSSGTTTAGLSDYYPTAGNLEITIRDGEVARQEIEFVGLVSRGALYVRATGLPEVAAAAYDVTGPDGFTASFSGTDTLVGLEPGVYTVGGQQLAVQDDVYRAWPDSESVSVIAGRYAPVFLTYGRVSDASLDLTIAAVEFTQAIQREDNSVPLIAGRDGFLRIYGTASEPNDVAPAMRVDWYQDGVFWRSDHVERTEASTPIAISRHDLTQSWNLPVAGAMVAADVSYRVTIDPDGDVPESLEGNNRYPADGSLAQPTIVSRDALGVRLIPIRQSVNDLQGDATADNAEDYVRDTGLLMPVRDVDVEVRAVYTTSAPALQADNGNGAWGQILAEVLALRQVEDHGGRHYYGVVRCGYTSGIAGLGRLPGTVAMGWDVPGSRGEVCAHELGHNLGLYHAPCGGPGSVDPDYPYADALIGVWGLDVETGEVKDPQVQHDLMSYCRPKWISDYMYEQVLGASASPPAIAEPRTTCLLVWGHVTGGELVLSPALVIDARPSIPEGDGPYGLIARDARDRVVLRHRFALPPIGDLPLGDGAFAWALPVRMDKAAQLATVTVDGPRSERAVQGRTDAAKSAQADPDATLARTGTLALRWNDAAYPLVMVRDGADGTVLGLVSGGEATLAAASGPLELWFSDGVQAVRRTMDAP